MGVTRPLEKSMFTFGFRPGGAAQFYIKADRSLFQGIQIQCNLWKIMTNNKSIYS